VNSIKLTNEEWVAFQDEIHPMEPISWKIREAGINPKNGMHIYRRETGVIVSGEPLKNPPPPPKQEIIYIVPTSQLTKPGGYRELEVSKTEVMNIFNELLDEWYGEAVCVIENMGSDEEKEMANLKKEEYIKRFKEAMGVPYEK